MAAEVGEKAPDFTLPAGDRENTVSPKDQPGAEAVLEDLYRAL